MKKNRLRSIIREEIKRTLSESIVKDNLSDIGYSQEEIDEVEEVVQKTRNALARTLDDLQNVRDQLRSISNNAADKLPNDVRKELSKDTSIQVKKQGSSDWYRDDIFYALLRSSGDLSDLTERLDDTFRAIDQILYHLED